MFEYFALLVILSGKTPDTLLQSIISSLAYPKPELFIYYR